MNCEWEGTTRLSVTVKEWVTQKLQWKKRKLLAHEGRMPLLDNERFQHLLAFSVHILALVSELSPFYISCMFTSVCKCHGNVSSECHCITATPRNILIYHPWLFSLQISIYTESDSYLQDVKKRNLIPKYLSHPPAVPLISVFKDSVLHYCLPNITVIDIFC